MAQVCEKSYYSKKGSSIQTTEYGAGKEIKSVTTLTVTGASLKNGEVTSDLHSVKTQDGKVTEDKTLHYSCNVNQVLWGVGAVDTKTKKEAAFNYPNNMIKGQDLKTNMVFEYQQTSPEGKNVKLSVKVNNRKVTGNESISTKAGTWKCIKITYDFELKIKVGFIGIPVKAKVTEWYNPEIGVVRSEIWAKDKLESYSEITSLKTGR
ncbi:hypothetical protein SOM12_04530 [Flavobacterium sp. CFBP9031]|uniref:TapB family protein n=1 Tax=Flavobacterium sp. CFBP9031 TaxID=3096538 RepID=UPI002A6B240F|nr:hypothetical protein [Flavobacterium sp. CFBP9031]MDY0986670.1 hypothetical protein [Flavobacterium sp. CFBP9031]